MWRFLSHLRQYQRGQCLLAPFNSSEKALSDLARRLCLHVEALSWSCGFWMELDDIIGLAYFLVSGGYSSEGYFISATFNLSVLACLPTTHSMFIHL